MTDLPENHPITKAVRTLELEAADLRERLAKAREDAIEECARVCEEKGASFTIHNFTIPDTGRTAANVCAATLRALSQKGADHE